MRPKETTEFDGTGGASGHSRNSVSRFGPVETTKRLCRLCRCVRTLLGGGLKGS